MPFAARYWGVLNPPCAIMLPPSASPARRRFTARKQVHDGSPVILGGVLLPRTAVGSLRHCGRRPLRRYRLQASRSCCGFGSSRPSCSRSLVSPSATDHIASRRRVVHRQPHEPTPVSRTFDSTALRWFEALGPLAGASGRARLSSASIDPGCRSNAARSPPGVCRRLFCSLTRCSRSGAPR